ncbi:hypothetical protein [Streptomyces sp. LN704]|uniref:hypothetical protein n=1 Tax=Streptomyces sp. LN704 TaxID=3112982 RepID=UPI0037147A8B
MISMLVRRSGLIQPLRQVPDGFRRVGVDRIGTQFADPVMPYQQFGQWVAVVDRGGVVHAQYLDRLVRAALFLAYARQQVHRVERLRVVSRVIWGCQENVQVSASSAVQESESRSAK